MRHHNQEIIKDLLTNGFKIPNVQSIRVLDTMEGLGQNTLLDDESVLIVNLTEKIDLHLAFSNKKQREKLVRIILPGNTKVYKEDMWDYAYTTEDRLKEAIEKVSAIVLGKSNQDITVLSCLTEIVERGC